MGITRLKQLSPDNSDGDCLRTTFACLLNLKQEDIETIPNFAAHYSKDYNRKLFDWLERKGLVYQETSLVLLNTPDAPNRVTAGFCNATIMMGETCHAIVGKIELTIPWGNDNATRCEFIPMWCPLTGDISGDNWARYVEKYKVEVIGYGFLNRRL